MDRPTRRYPYETDGARIYAQSFATIRLETDLTGLPANAERAVVRLVHAAGDPAVARDVQVTEDFVPAARAALQAGAPILTDAMMVAGGVTRTRLPAGNEVRCLIRDERTSDLARQWGTTRSAAAVSLWGDAVDGAVVAFGNAPTALFHLLEVLADGGARPAAVVGVPVGFVGSAESKRALAAYTPRLPFLTVHGRRGGSAMAAAVLNAVAQEEE